LGPHRASVRPLRQRRVHPAVPGRGLRRPRRRGALNAPRHPETAMPVPATVASPVVTCLRYRNASAAIEWLVQAFGFEAQRIVPGPADTIVHAQLTLGSGMIMLASVTDTPF